MRFWKGFTLIELLVVVIVIAVLAAIAIPNFLEAQVRAKVSRARSDLRAVATGLEAYAVDNSNYPPNDGLFNVLPIELTTPVSYLSNVSLIDPFSGKELHPVYGELARHYTYTLVVLLADLNRHALAGNPPPVEGVDGGVYNPGAFERYGRWRLVSNGPDREYLLPGAPQDIFNPHPLVLKGADIPYDATNGTVSDGNLLRTQKRAE